MSLLIWTLTIFSNYTTHPAGLRREKEGKMKRLFRDFYGNTACIRTRKDGSARLTISIGAKRVKSQNYKSERGARIALGKFGDSFSEIK